MLRIRVARDVSVSTKLSQMQLIFYMQIWNLVNPILTAFVSYPKIIMRMFKNIMETPSPQTQQTELSFPRFISASLSVSQSYSVKRAVNSTDGIAWDTSGVLPYDKIWSSVTYGNGKFVAVANDALSSISAYSTDGIKWTYASLKTKANWISVTYGNGKFVAVANNSNAVAYSTDGITWTAKTLPSTANWISVTYGDGKFVVVAYSSNQAAYSSDGITWTAVTLPSTATWQSVAYGDGKFVTVAYNGSKAAYSDAYGPTINIG